METLVLSRPLTRNGSVGNPCGLHRGQWVWHNSSSCVDRGTVAHCCIKLRQIDRHQSQTSEGEKRVVSLFLYLTSIKVAPEDNSACLNQSVRKLTNHEPRSSP